MTPSRPDSYRGDKLRGNKTQYLIGCQAADLNHELWQFYSFRPFLNNLGVKRQRKDENYVIKHSFSTNNPNNACRCTNYTLSLHRDFFIVLDLRLTKIGSQARLPFSFFRRFVYKHNIRRVRDKLF